MNWPFPEPTSVLLLTLPSVAPCRRVTAHHQAQALVPVWRVGGEVRLVTRRRRPLHPLPPAHVGDGAWEEGHGQRMPQSPLDQLVAPVTNQTSSFFFFFFLTPPQQLTNTSSLSGNLWNNRSWRTFKLEKIFFSDRFHTSVISLIGVDVLRKPIISPKRNVSPRQWRQHDVETVSSKAPPEFKDECSPALYHQDSNRSLFFPSLFQILDRLVDHWQLLITSVMWEYILRGWALSLLDFCKAEGLENGARSPFISFQLRCPPYCVVNEALTAH